MIDWRKTVARFLVIGGVVAGLLQMGREAVAIYTYLSLSVGDASVVESNFTPTAMQFVVTLSKQSRNTVTVSFFTEDRSAKSPEDYVAKSGTLVFHPGQTVATIDVKVQGDLLDEPTETFLVHLADSVNAFIADGVGTGRIKDNDPLPSISTSDTRVKEGDAGTVAATFTVSLSHASGKIVEVAYTTENGSAKEPSDYVGTEGTITFTEGTTSKTVTVKVKGDTKVETNERFFLVLLSSENGVISDGVGICTIKDDDP